MIKDDLINMYKQAKSSKLMSMFNQSRQYEDEARKLDAKSNAIDENLVRTVKEKFPNVKDHGFMSDECELQISKMDKQWRLVAASMVTVKRSIQLSGFHTGMNLYANSRYGCKEHKRYSGWSPFAWGQSIMDYAKDAPKFVIQPNVLCIKESQLRFGVLDTVPQLDQEKVDQLKRITQETVWLIDSWRNFYNTLDVDRIKRIKGILGMSSYINDPNEFKMILKDIDMLVAFNKTLSAKVESQVAKWEPTIAKWQEVNKNFLVLNELSKTELKV